MSELRTGRVVRGDAKVYHVDFDGEVRPCAPRGRLFEERGEDRNPIAVGDRVRVSAEGDPPGIEEVLPRDNWLPRVASSHDPRAQVLFANVDQLFVVGSVAKPRLSTNRTDRILASCTYYEIPAHLILNKVDLDRHGEAAELRATYDAAGVRVIGTSATTGVGVDTVADLLRGRVSVLYGASGAGKSTLINAIQPDLDLKVGKISRYWDAGKHTTTFSQMHRLDAVDAWIIDTPGIRVFRLYGINKAELRDLFPEFAPFREHCRFPDCSHDHEPDCAVYEAVEAGEIALTRYQSYVQILDELAPPPEDDGVVEPPEG
jgi:ribosome biogenesis GTPase